MTRQVSLLFVIVFSIFISACTGLAGEPDVVATLPPPTAEPLIEETSEPRFPQTMPDIENGAQIFASHCVDCHGETGDGQGQLVIEGSIPQPPDMTDLSLTSLNTPLEWYDTITNGRIENLMPPWKNALTTEERWDVAFYAYTLAYEEDMLLLGEQVWTDKCAECDAVNALTNLESAVSMSDASFGSQIDRDNFDSNLTVEEIRAAVAYARSQSVDNPSSIGLILDPLPIGEDPDITVGDFTGTVEHGTEGSDVPPDTVVQLQYGNARSGFEFAQTTINEDRTFTFEDIPLTNTYIYSVGAVYRDRLFSKMLREGHDESTAYDQTLTIYDLTDDPYVISISRIDMFIDPMTVQDIGEGLRVTQIIQYNNSSDRMYTTGRSIGDGREAVTLVQVPVGSLITSGEANGRYLIVQDIEGTLDSIIDTYPIPPGNQHEILVEYFVPYVDGAIIDQPFVNAINGEVTITIDNRLEVISNDLSLTEEGTTGENLNIYSGTLNITSNPKLIFEIKGNPFVAQVDEQVDISSDALFPILLGIVVVLVIIVIVIIVFFNRSNHDRGQIDALIKQIAELDTMHDNGQINHDVYQRQRQDLKDKLTALMQANNSKQDK